jgi:hypothetical protein
MTSLPRPILQAKIEREGKEKLQAMSPMNNQCWDHRGRRENDGHLQPFPKFPPHHATPHYGPFGWTDKPAEKHCWLICYEKKNTIFTEKTS